MKGLPRTLRNADLLNSGGYFRQTIPVRKLPLTVSAAGAAVGFGNATIGGLPQGNILFFGGLSYLQFRTSDANITNAAFTSSYAIGSAADVDGTLSAAPATESFFIDAIANGAATAKVSPVVRGLTATAQFASPAIIDNTDQTTKFILNLIVTAADIADSTSAVFQVDGYVTFAFIVLGDD